MNPLIILDIPFGGYGIAKRLNRYGIPLHGFYHVEDKWPEINTRICHLYTYENDTDIIAWLDHIKQSYRETPVLIFTNDNQVKFFVRHYEWLKDKFLFNMPHPDNINAFMYKDQFLQFAKEHGIRVPWTRHLDTPESFDEVEYPCFVKPNGNWSHAFKGYICHDPDDARALLQHGLDLIAQEWVPGPSSNILATYMYFNKQGHCLATMTGNKVREWPIQSGSGCCFGPVNESGMEMISIEAFKNNQYHGIGSMEMKRHEGNGKLYAIEPTVGRVDVGSEFTAINGLDIPAMYYFDVIQKPMPRSLFRKPSKPRYWIHELMDVQSIMALQKAGRLNKLETLKTYLRGKMHFFNWDDLAPFWTFFKSKILKVR